MKMNSQSRSFARQVQVDLLALNDADLFHIVHQWVDGSGSSGISKDIPEEVYSALGYTRVLVETPTLPHLSYDNETSPQWLAPSPYDMRAIITAMDVNVFAQCVITTAFQALHGTYPDWYEGITFNAHLANYLRQMKKERHVHRSL